MIFQIDESTPYPTFPDPRAGDEDGLFAVGGDLSIDRLLLAYCHGIFPWYSFRDQPDILWYCPMQRFVIFPEDDTREPLHAHAHQQRPVQLQYQ